MLTAAAVLSEWLIVPDASHAGTQDEFMSTGIALYNHRQYAAAGKVFVQVLAGLLNIPMHFIMPLTVTFF